MRPGDDPSPGLVAVDHHPQAAAVEDHHPQAAATRLGPTHSGQAAEAAGGPASRHPIRSEEHLLTARHAVRAATLDVGFTLVDQTRVVTAASELVRNAYIHGGGGTLTIEVIHRADVRGLRLTVTDHGPGISDLDAAFTDGYTTGPGLGHGLGGARRLMDDFHVHTAEGHGTTVIATRWTTQS
ncbi:ATP-binding protein [Streptomyces lavendofoliae]|uniref:ATP-binding protein n=1 Tax=Streptomyces lavendofoliae TaxID=67314 RepID=UPI00300F30EE